MLQGLLARGELQSAGQECGRGVDSLQGRGESHERSCCETGLHSETEKCETYNYIERLGNCGTSFTKYHCGTQFRNSEGQ